MSETEFVENLKSVEKYYLDQILPIYLLEVEKSINHLSESFLDKDFEKVCFYTHKINGSSKMMNLKKLTTYCLTIEAQVKKGNIEVGDEIDALRRDFLLIKKVSKDEFNILPMK